MKRSDSIPYLGIEIAAVLRVGVFVEPVRFQGSRAGF
jgi:hypothetical protein